MTWMCFVSTANRKGRGAAAAFLIPTRDYNDFCSAAFSAKRKHAGVAEVDDEDLNVGACFSRRQFDSERQLTPQFKVARDLAAYARSRSPRLIVSEGAEADFDLANPTSLGAGVAGLIIALRLRLETLASGQQASLHLPQTDHRVDERVACRVYEALAAEQTKPGGDLHRIPVFNVLALSPGLQMARITARFVLDDDPARLGTLGTDLRAMLAAV